MGGTVNPSFCCCVHCHWFRAVVVAVAVTIAAAAAGHECPNSKLVRSSPNSKLVMGMLKVWMSNRNSDKFLEFSCHIKQLKSIGCS